MAISTTATRKTVVLPGAVIKANSAKGEITAVVNTGYRDRQKDTMVYGCWQKVCSEKQRPILFWHHDLKELALGSVPYLEELAPGDNRIPPPTGTSFGRESYDAGALLARMQFALETQRGHDAFILARDGHVSEWSVQFTTTPDGEESDGKGGRIVKMVDWLIEVSLVPAGASLGTYTIGAKAPAVMDASLKADLLAIGAAYGDAYVRSRACGDSEEVAHAYAKSVVRGTGIPAEVEKQDDGPRTNWAKWRRLRGL